MKGELVFLSNPVNSSNLSRLAREASAEFELRILELSDIVKNALDIAHELCAEGLGIYEILSFLAERMDFGTYDTHEDALLENRKIMSAYLGILNELDKAVFCDLFSKGAKEQGISLEESEFLPERECDESFTYVKNPFADEAFDVFLREYSDPRVRYSKTFKECAEAVSSGAVSYCLLPLEERGGARLHTVAELIFRNDFRINSVTPVFGMDNNADIKYAMVSRHFTVPECSPEDDRYLEIRLGQNSERAITEFIAVSSFLGHSIYRVNTSTFVTESGEETFFTVVLRDEGRDFTSLLVYLSVFAQDFAPVGIYKNLE